MSKGGVAVHSKNCLNALNAPKQKLLNASWKKDLDEKFNVNLKIVAKDKIGYGAKLLGLFASENFNISRMEAKRSGASDCEFELSVSVQDKDELQGLINKIKTIPEVRFVGRAHE
jgi:GTP pyrophosphokinase